MMQQDYHGFSKDDKAHIFDNFSEVDVRHIGDKGFELFRRLFHRLNSAPVCAACLLRFCCTPHCYLIALYSHMPSLPVGALLMPSRCMHAIRRSACGLSRAGARLRRACRGSVFSGESCWIQRCAGATPGFLIFYLRNPLCGSG
jgi:hypothetical protein